MDNTGKILIITGIAVSALMLRKALGGAANPPIAPSLLERQVMRHDDLIWRVAQRQDVEPALIAAIMAVESSGIHRGARRIDVRKYDGQPGTDYVVGLMQVRLATAGTYCDIWPTFDLEPDAENVDCGVRYLKAMLDKFGAVAPAVSAYNAGAGRVQWDSSMVGGMQYVNLSYVRKVLGMIPRFRLLFMGSQGASLYMTLFPGNRWDFVTP